MATITVNPGNNLTSILSSISSGDTVYINNGTYNLSEVHPPTNVTIQGQSTAGVIINISNVAYAIYLRTGSTVKNCTFKCSGTVKVIYVSGVQTNWRVESCNFINATIAVIAENTDTAMPADCNGYIINNTGTGSKLMTLQGQNGVTITGNKFYDRNGSEFVDFNYNVHYCLFDSNELINNTGFSMAEEMIDMVGGNSTTQSFNTVSNNKIIGNFQSGIRPAKSAIDNIITNNYIEWKSGPAVHEGSVYIYGYGTGFDCPKRNQITNNSFVGGTCAIKMSVGQDNTITGNTVSDCTRAIALVANTIYGDDLAPQNNIVQYNTFVRVTSCVTNEGTNTVFNNTCNSTTPTDPGTGGVISNATIAWLGDARPSKFGTVGITELTEDLNACLSLSPTGRLDAIVLVGDFDTGKQTEKAIVASACKNIPFIWVVGNHEIDSGGIAEARARGVSLPASLNRLAGPSGTDKTTYSVDVGNIHLVNINVFWDGASNDGKSSVKIPPALQTWISSNLAASTKKWKLATAHTPLYPYKRHVNDGGLDSNKTTRDALQASFVANNVSVFFGAHTHYSAIHQIGGIYHCDAGVSGHKTSDGEDSKASIFYTYQSGDNMILKWLQEPWTSPVTKATYTIAASGGGSSGLPDMTPTELAAYNGKSGQPAYVAINNIVYDVSSSSAWTNGLHKTIHSAGQDLTTAFLGKHASSVISSFTPVANLVADSTPLPDIPKWVCSGSPNYTPVRDDTATSNYYLSEELCRAACKRPEQPEGTGWDSGITQAAGVWFKLNLHGLVPIKTLFLNNMGTDASHPYRTKYPRNFTVQASSDNNNWDEITTISNNQNPDVIINFPGTLYRYVKISLTDAISGTLPDGTTDDTTETWAIGELNIYTYHPVIAQWTDEDSTAEHGVYEDVLRDPALTTKTQAFSRAVDEVNARKSPSISGSIQLRYYFDVEANELVSVTVPGTNISQKFVVQSVAFNEGAKGTFNEQLTLRSV